jgi:hypothetical protein
MQEKKPHNKLWSDVQRLMENATVVVEVVDIRDVKGTRLPIGEKMAGSNRLLIMANKADLVDSIPELPSNAIAVSAKNADRKAREHLIEAIMARSTRPLTRALFIGYPNVGKSTLINMLAGRRAAKVSPRAGTTTNVQWVRINERLVASDYRGLFPKHESRESLVRKSAVNVGEDAELHAHSIAKRILERPKLRIWLEKRYDVDLSKAQNSEDVLAALAERRKWYLKGGKLNIAEAARNLIRAMLFAPET